MKLYSNIFFMGACIILVSSSMAFAQQKITITPAGRIKPLPIVKVERATLPTVPGVVVASMDSKLLRPIIEPEYVQSLADSLPLPAANPLAVGYCEMDIYVFEKTN